MLGYYLDLALRSLKRNKALTALMVLTIGLGIGAAMTTLTVLHALSSDPLPARSAHLYRPQIDPQDLNGYRVGEKPPAQMTWIDGMNLLHAKQAQRQALMARGAVAIYPTHVDIDPFRASARFTTAGFFAMFGVPFQYGHAWHAKADGARARVAVISRQLNAKLFAGGDSVGKSLDVGGHAFRIVGVMSAWRPSPHFYDLSDGAYGPVESVFVPLTTALDLDLHLDVHLNCWGNAPTAESQLTHASCTWLQFWVQLDTPARVAAYKQFLVHYSQQQKAMGRFLRPPDVGLPTLMQWLYDNDVVPDSVTAHTWLAFGFLLVCLVNAVGLLLAKFLRRADALGVRRAMGASRRTVFVQLLIESGMVGVLGGLLGLLLALAGLWLVRQQPTGYAALAHLDASMLLFAMALAIVASLLAGVLPAWRACRIAPALQMKRN